MIFDFATIDRKNKGNLYNDIYKSIKEAVLCGAVKKGEKLPSVREAAAQLGVSRTTVENAYIRLCIEGIAESRPQRGYFIIGSGNTQRSEKAEKIAFSPEIKYDFSSRRIDTSTADTENWKRLIRQVLRDSHVLTSYGDPQGERELREALASYSYKARGVNTTADNIIVGAGIGPLLNILCGLFGRDAVVGIEGGSFKAAESIFGDYGIDTIPLECDSNGAVIEDIEKSGINVLFLMPSALSKISINALSKRRAEFSQWAEADEKRIIIEDDYNGELRYTARTVPAFQNKSPESCIYIGSFSKLLLPSVRIAYMVLPESLMKILRNKMRYYNQTCGKTEQLALTEYINSGGLEKHLRRLRRLYYLKSQVLSRELQENISSFSSIELYESSLTVELNTNIDVKSEEICHAALYGGIKIMPSYKNGSVRLCFAGIENKDIAPAVKALNQVLTKFV